MSLGRHHRAGKTPSEATQIWLCIVHCRDKTMVLAFNGLGKVMCAHVLTVLALSDIVLTTCSLAYVALLQG